MLNMITATDLKLSNLYLQEDFVLTVRHQVFDLSSKNSVPDTLKKDLWNRTVF